MKKKIETPEARGKLRPRPETYSEKNNGGCF